MPSISASITIASRGRCRSPRWPPPPPPRCASRPCIQSALPSCPLRPPGIQPTISSGSPPNPDSMTPVLHTSFTSSPNSSLRMRSALVRSSGSYLPYTLAAHLTLFLLVSSPKSPIPATYPIFLRLLPLYPKTTHLTIFAASLVASSEETVCISDCSSLCT